MEAVRYDLVLKNGTVYDSAAGLRGARRDIAVRDGRIAAVAESIDPRSGREVRDLAGMCVSAGWVDIHVHAYGGLGLRDVQMVGALNGSTTVVDAGDFGTTTFDDFTAMKADSVADVYGYVHLLPVGIPYTGLARGEYDAIDVDAIHALIERGRDSILGVKMGALGDLPFRHLERGKAVARRAGVRFYMHIGEVSYFPTKRTLTRQALELLEEGDIATHIYSNDHGRVVDEAGKVVPELFAARERGVTFDVGNGIGNFSYAVAERVMDQGIEPDTISSDQNSLCAQVNADLPATMSRFLMLGMRLEDVLHKVTAAPARALGLQAGTLAVGSRADITVFRIESGEFPYVDSDRVTRTADRAVVPDHVYKDGRRHDCDVARIYRGNSFAMKARPAAEAGGVELDAAERRFVGRFLSEMDGLPDESWQGPAIQDRFGATLAATGMGRRQALGALYRLVLAEDSQGFTPQIGAFLARIGREDVRALRQAMERASAR